MLLEPLTETEKAYLAGFLDGEGCITIIKGSVVNSPVPYYHLVVIIAQADKPVLEKWRNRTGVGRVYRAGHIVGITDSRGIKTTKQGYAWRITNKEAQTFLYWILPYLDIKGGQAAVALDFCATVEKQGGTTGCRQLPVSILNLRERYRQVLKQMKHGTGETEPLTPSEKALDELYHSQLALFDLD